MAATALTDALDALEGLTLDEALHAVRVAERREDLLAFVEDSERGYMAGHMHRMIADELMWFSREVAARRSPRLEINAPPQRGKSFMASERFPLWHMAKHPGHKAIVASFNKDKAVERSRKALELMQREMFRETFPRFGLGGLQRMHDWESSQGNRFTAVDAQGGATSQPADILIFDDPFKGRVDVFSPTKREQVWDTYQGSGLSRMTAGGGIILINTRWHHDDLSGRIRRHEEKQAKRGRKHRRWRRLILREIAEVDEGWRGPGDVLHPERRSRDQIYIDREEMETYWWEALYQQRPGSREGNIIREEWLDQRYKNRPERFDQIIITCDPSHGALTESASYNFVGVIGKLGADSYLLDADIFKGELPELIERFRAMCAKWPQALVKLVEDKAHGRAIVQTLAREIPGIQAVKVAGRSKEERLVACTPIFSAGNFWLPDDAPWLEMVMHQLLSFPASAHDDVVDAITQALDYLYGVTELEWWDVLDDDDDDWM